MEPSPGRPCSRPAGEELRVWGSWRFPAPGAFIQHPLGSSMALSNGLGHGRVLAEVLPCNVQRVGVRLKGGIQVPQEFQLRGHVVVGDGEHGNSFVVHMRRGLNTNGRNAIFQKSKCGLSVLQGNAMAAKLGLDRGGVEVRISARVRSSSGALEFEGFVQILEGRAQPALLAKETCHVVVRESQLVALALGVTLRLDEVQSSGV